MNEGGDGHPVYMEALRRLAAEHAGSVAVMTEARRVSFGDLWGEVGSLSAWLGRQGLAPGDVVGITIRDEYRNLIATLAAMHAGLAQVTLPTHEPAGQRAEVAARTGVVAVLGDDEAHALPGVPLLQLDFDFRSEAPVPVAQPGDGTCLILASSGTTGRAKLIPIGQRQLVAQAETYQWPRRRNVFYRPASIEFNNSRRQRLYTLVLGDANVLADPVRRDVHETCRAEKVTWLGLSVAQSRVLISRQLGPLPAGVAIRMGGSAVPPKLRRELVESLGAAVFVAYGTSEMGSIATAGADDLGIDMDTLGEVHSGVELELVDDADRLVLAGSAGLVRVRAAGMATRYHDDPEATARAFRNGWFYPGDVAHRDVSGRLIFEGRADDMMNLASMNVFPAEIERVVDAMSGVVESAAFAMKSAQFGDVPMVAVVADGVIDVNAIRAQARQALGLRAPRRVVVVDALPRNRQGKIVRGQLASLLASRSDKVLPE